MNRNFNALTDFELVELEVPMICLVTGCVSARRDRRYFVIKFMQQYDEAFVGGLSGGYVIFIVHS